MDRSFHEPTTHAQWVECPPGDISIGVKDGNEGQKAKVPQWGGGKSFSSIIELIYRVIQGVRSILVSNLSQTNICYFILQLSDESLYLYVFQR